VVPIGRHHHEHWNGAGYPAGISGTDIPLGARILSVVDCFDALTSDRPYRPKLNVEEAFKIIRDQSGTSYDPLIVDAFVKNYSEIAPIAFRAGQEARSLVDAAILGTTSAGEVLTPLRQISANASEAALLETCARDIGRAASPTAALQATAHCLRQLTPATVYTLFSHDGASDVVTCVSTVGDEHRLLDGLTITLGERVTGWVAANYRTSVNSDASLDLTQISNFFSPPLRSTISTPLVRGERLIGVLTAYSPRSEAFDETHRYVFEQVASILLDKLYSLAAIHSSNVVSFPLHKPN
jgi:hypothetical protein